MLKTRRSRFRPAVAKDSGFRLVAGREMLTEMQVHGFRPIADARARVLILGTMPSPASLRARQYYAHPQNAFWRIAAEVLGFDPRRAYADRASLLKANGVALWDVLKSCVRDGSLDSAIDPDTIVLNDFRRFLRTHPLVARVCFNGATAEALYAKHVRPQLAEPGKLEYLRLPSTSPANASVPWTKKLRAWKAIRLTPWTPPSSPSSPR